MTQPPWRRERREHFPGVPAWSLATSRLAPEEFGVSRLEDVTREWAWGGDGAGEGGAGGDDLVGAARAAPTEPACVSACSTPGWTPLIRGSAAWSVRSWSPTAMT